MLDERWSILSSLSCRVCGFSNFELVLDLGDQPWGNGFIRPDEIHDEKKYPLRLIYCNRCTTSQLDFTIPKEEMFVHHTYLSGTTKTLESHFEILAKRVSDRFNNVSRPLDVLDIGSNDGTQLRQYLSLGHNVLGVESAKQVSEIANNSGIKTINDFFNLECAKQINSYFDVINASGVFFHLEELHSVCEGIKLLLHDNGIFVVQFIYMKLMQENIAFDQIYHEHLLFYTLDTISHLLKQHGLEMFDAEISPIHGGSVIGYVGHIGKRETTTHLQNLMGAEEKARSNTYERYKQFADDVLISKSRTVSWVERAKKEGKTIYGLGAPVKGNTLLNFFQLGPREISILVERNPLRRGLVSPGMHIPIVLEDEVHQRPDKYLVLAWNFREEIIQRHAEDIQAGTELFFPVEIGEKQ